MVRKLLVAGILAGLVGGLLAFGVARILGEPQVDRAISFESYVEHDVHHEEGEADLVSRSVQSSAGLGTGAIVYGVAMGGLFALAFTLAYGRLGTLTARGTAAVLALVAFVSVYVVPILKFPANPPSVGDPDTIGRRTVLYLVMILLSVALAAVAVVARRRLRDRVGEWNATVLAGLGYAVAVVIAFVALPGVNEVPQVALRGVVGAVTDAGVTFPPTVLWRFRMASLGIQAITWAAIAIVFGARAERVLAAHVVEPAPAGPEPALGPAAR
jgi:hypothetical protein